MSERQRLQWLRRDLRQTLDRMEVDQQHVQEIREEIDRIEHEVTTKRRRFRLIHGGAAVVGTGIAETVKWIGQHPTATVIATIASVGGFLGTAAFTSDNLPQPPVAAPAPVIPGPQSTVPEIVPAPTFTTTPSTASGEPGTQRTNSHPDVLAIRRPDGTHDAVKPPSNVPPSNTSSNTSPTTPPTTQPSGPASDPPATDHHCGGIHVTVPQLVDLCLLG